MSTVVDSPVDAEIVCKEGPAEDDVGEDRDPEEGPEGLAGYRPGGGQGGGLFGDELGELRLHLLLLLFHLLLKIAESKPKVRRPSGQ